MTPTLFKQKTQTCYLHRGLLALAVYLLLASTSLVHNSLTQRLPLCPTAVTGRMAKFT